MNIYTLYIYIYIKYIYTHTHDIHTHKYIHHTQSSLQYNIADVFIKADSNAYRYMFKNSSYLHACCMLKLKSSLVAEAWRHRANSIPRLGTDEREHKEMGMPACSN